MTAETSPRRAKCNAPLHVPVPRRADLFEEDDFRFDRTDESAHGHCIRVRIGEGNEFQPASRTVGVHIEIETLHASRAISVRMNENLSSGISSGSLRLRRRWGRRLSHNFVWSSSVDVLENL